MEDAGRGEGVKVEEVGLDGLGMMMGASLAPVLDTLLDWLEEREWTMVSIAQKVVVDERSGQVDQGYPDKVVEGRKEGERRKGGRKRLDQELTF